MVLMDTHILLWAFSDSDRLTESVRNAIDENDVCISIASLWEIAIKASLKRTDKRLELEDTIQTIADTCKAQGIDIIPITPDDCQRIRALPHHHEDPFDRIIIAQAIERDIPLITKDDNIWNDMTLTTIVRLFGRGHTNLYLLPRRRKTTGDGKMKSIKQLLSIGIDPYYIIRDPEILDGQIKQTM